MLDWQIGTLVESKQTASDIKSLFFKIANWTGHLAGQHCDFRLTAENGYQAQRSYSIASAPGENLVEFGVQLLSDGEVSPFLWAMQPGDEVEIKGPIGGHFIWQPELPGDLILVGGGAGIAPLLSIYKHSQKVDPARHILFIEGAQSTEKIMYWDELKDALIVRISSTDGHIDESFLREKVGMHQEHMPLIYVCGPTPFVETVTTALVNLGYNSHSIRTERFG